MTSSARLALPLLAPGQAQKEITHNEALTRLDLAVQASVETLGLNNPPAAPEPGQCWVIGPAPTGAWVGKAHHLAGWTDGGWRFLQPFPGLVVWIAGDAMFAHWDGVFWVKGVLSAAAVSIGGDQIIGPRQAGITLASGGGVVDAQARSAIEEVLHAMRVHGLIES